MPLRKHGTIVSTALVVGALGLTIPTSANAGLLSGLLKPAATPTPTVKAAPTPTPTAVATSASSSGSITTTNTATTSSTSATTSSAVPSGVGCTALPTTKAFQKVDGDSADYSLAPNGNFENGTGGWTLAGGAKVVSSVNENLGISAGSKALQIPLSGSATSPAFCVDETNPHFRFAYKVDNASLSGFIAYVIYRNAAGQITNVQLVSSKALALAPSVWQATPASPLATIIPLNSSTKTASVQLKITALNPTDFVDDTADAIIGDNAATDLVHTVGSAGSGLVASISGAVSPITNIGITIDSVMVDPYRRG